MKITKTSIFSGTESTLDLPITQEQLARIADGELIQNVLPHLSADEREFLLTGAMPGEWDAIFGDGDEGEGVDFEDERSDERTSEASSE